MIYKKTWKYILIKDSNLIYYKLKAVKDFSNVFKGNLGGYLDGYHNLSQKGDCWIYGNAWVYGNAQVSENAKIYGNSQVYGKAQVYGNAIISGQSMVYGHARIYGNANIENQRIL